MKMNYHYTHYPLPSTPNPLPSTPYTPHLDQPHRLCFNPSVFAPALQSRNFRLFWFGQILSNAGTTLQVVAEGWLIYQITESTFWLGMVTFMSLLPVLPISLLGGLLIDRVPRRKLIIATQTGLLIQAAVFAYLGLTDQIELWHIILLYFIFGSLLAIDHPARRAFLVELVPEDDLANAVALNATIFNISSLVGYVVGGFLIATVGAGGAMLVNALTYLAPITALSLIRLNDIGHDKQAQPLKTALSEGLLVLWQQPALLGTIALMAVVGGLSYPIIGLMPAYAEEVIKTDAIGLGILLGAVALGSLIGTVITARLGGQKRGRSLAIFALILPILMGGVALAKTIAVAIPFLIAMGMALLVLQSLAITLVQVHIPGRVRGRVMSLYSILQAGSDTGSNALIGSLASLIGLPLALSLASLLALTFASTTWFTHPQTRNLD